MEYVESLNLPDSASKEANIGTAAHAFAEICLKEGIAPADKIGTAIRPNKDEEAVPIDSEMADAVSAYIGYVRSDATLSSGAKHFTELKVSLADWVPDSFGTIDHLTIDGATLIVTDFKYGWYAVHAEDNPQLLLYALGALSAFEIAYPVDTVKLRIFQPRCNNVSEVTLSRTELILWADTVLKPVVDKLQSGDVEFSPGTHCRFCPAKTNCKARKDHELDFTKRLEQLHANEVSNEELSQWLTAIMELTKRDELEHEAFNRIYNRNETVPGFKVVKGRGSRQWKEGAIAELEKEYSDVTFYEVKPKSPYQVERSGEVDKEELTDYIVYTEGSPVLKKESDRGTPVTRNADELFTNRR